VSASTRSAAGPDLGQASAGDLDPAARCSASAFPSSAADGAGPGGTGRSGGSGTDAPGALPRVVHRRVRTATDRVGVVLEAALDRVGLGHLAHRVWQVVRYGAVSIIATLTSMTVLGALLATATLTPGWANIVATGVGTVPSFELNRRWVWGRTGRRSVAAEIGPFCVLSFAGLALSTLLVSLAGRWADAAGLDALWRASAVEVANVAAFGSLWILQFLILDRVLFARRGPGPRTDGSGAAGEGPLPAGAGPVAVSVPAPTATAAPIPSAGARADAPPGGAPVAA